MADEKPIYDFSDLKEFLGERGIRVGSAQGYIPVAPEDVFDKQGNTSLVFENEYGEDGIFVPDRTGRLHQVYMYKFPYHVSGYTNSIPRFHICKCKVIESFMSQGRFGEYHYANTEEVDVKDLDRMPNRVIQMSGLPLCSLCAEEMSRKYDRDMDSDEFVQILKEAGQISEKKEVNVDIFGYTEDWPEISKAYRTKQNFTCEKCGFTAPSAFERGYIHVHHKDGDKLNNDPSNLQCLCIRCHANVDETHRKNFSTGDKHRQLVEFCKLHKVRVTYIKKWKLWDYCEEFGGERSFSWGTSKQTHKRVAIYVKGQPVMFDELMGDMEGDQGAVKIRNSVIVQKPDGNKRIYPLSEIELVQYEDIV